MAEGVRGFWEEVYQRFNPEQPAQGAALRAERPYSPRQDIASDLLRPFGTDKKYAVLGTVGTGKTTELLAVAEDQTRHRMVVFLDVWRHFQERVGDPAAIEHVQPWEVLFLIGLAVYRSAQEIFGHEWADQHVETFDRAVQAFLDIDGPKDGDTPASKRFDLARLIGNVAALAGGAVDGGTGLVLRALGAASNAGQWNFRLGERGRKRLSDQDDRVRTLQNTINLLISTVQHRYRDLLVVVDGLDRVKNENTTRGLFIDSTVLGNLACATVLTCPLTLRRRRLAAQIRHFEPIVLANVPVLSHDQPDQPGPGIEFFLDLYRRRVATLDIDSLGISDPWLRKLAYYSGGRARDFVRLVRMCAEYAWDGEIARVGQNIVDQCIDERRRIMELGMTRGHVRLLQAVMDDPAHLLPDDDQIEELLDQWSLLPFPNESEWYYPHPLLTLQLLKPG